MVRAAFLGGTQLSIKAISVIRPQASESEMVMHLDANEYAGQEAVEKPGADDADGTAG